MSGIDAEFKCDQIIGSSAQPPDEFKDARRSRNESKLACLSLSKWDLSLQSSNVMPPKLHYCSNFPRDAVPITDSQREYDIEENL